MPDLHLEILRPPQRRLWDILQRDAGILRTRGFILVGGTALALQIGHRESHDFDFFARRPGVESIRTWLECLPGFVLRDVGTNTIHAELERVKVSFISGYRYPFLMPPVPAGRLVMAGVADIGLMKMLAITHRATLRDYIDLAAVIRDHAALEALIEMSTKKYGDAFNVMVALRAMVHFEDLDGEMPVILDRTLASSWQHVLRKAVKEVA